MKPLSFLFFLLMTWLGQSLHAQADVAAVAGAATGTAADENSVLWQISGNGLTKPSYLFGTVHILPKEDYAFSPAAQKALKACTSLVLETDLEMKTVDKSEIARKTMLPDGKTLKDVLPAADYTRFMALMDSMGVSKLNQMVCERMKPIYATSVLVQAMSGKTESYEMRLLKMAKKEKMEYLWLEELTYQLDVLDGMTLEEQIASFGEDMSVATFKRLFGSMIDAYQAQDINALHTLMLEESGSISNFEERLLNQRNRNWVPVIAKYAAAQPSFIAVGAGHLAGEQGVISLLRNAGYTVTAVK